MKRCSTVAFLIATVCLRALSLQAEIVTLFETDFEDLSLSSPEVVSPFACKGTNYDVWGAPKHPSFRNWQVDPRSHSGSIAINVIPGGNPVSERGTALSSAELPALDVSMCESVWLSYWVHSTSNPRTRDVHNCDSSLDIYYRKDNGDWQHYSSQCGEHKSESPGWEWHRDLHFATDDCSTIQFAFNYGLQNNLQHDPEVFYLLDDLTITGLANPALFPGTPTEGFTLVGEGAPKRVLVPAGPIAEAWKASVDFDDSDWLDGTGGVGYERSVGYEQFFNIDVQDQMYGRNASCYIRIPFTVSADEIANATGLLLRVRYDDGFIAYLNGVEIQRALFDGVPAWNSGASSNHSDIDAIGFQDFDASQFWGLLTPGENLLAIHALNETVTSSDFLISVELLCLTGTSHQRELTISQVGEGQVLPGEGTFVYLAGTVVDVNAVPSPGYRFAGWTGSAVNGGGVADPLVPQTTVVVDGDYTLTANFKPLDDPWDIVYSNDFEGQVGLEWSRTTTDVTPIGARRFLGQFGNDTVTLTLRDLPLHAGMRLSLDLFVIRTWDGAGAAAPAGGSVSPGPDIWAVGPMGGSALLSTSFDNNHMSPYRQVHTQSYPGSHPNGRFPPQTGAVETNSLGYDFDFSGVGLCPADAVYRLSFAFAHSETAAYVQFSASGLQALSDESWGLDNVQVEVSNDPLAPLTASAPSPANEAEGVIPFVLRWKASGTAVHHDVYFGLSAGLSPREFIGRKSTTECIVPFALVPGTTYYWRVDEVEADGTTIHTGEVWSFTTGAPVMQMRVLTVSSYGVGSVLTPGEGQFEVPQGTVLTIEAAPADSANEFRTWIGTAVSQGKVADPNAARTTVLIDGDYTLAAVFALRAQGPALGFSLGELTLDDPGQFNYRVATNNTPEATFVELVTGLAPDPNGMVRMQVVADEPARTKARFGKYEGQRVLVRFSYLFEDPGADLELVAYLSDVPQLLGYDDPLRATHYVEIGRVPVPPTGCPGAFGSRRFGVFQEWVWTTGLDLSNGTWVELELVQASGPATLYALTSTLQTGIRMAAPDDSGDGSALVDGWAAEAHCDGYCMDLNWSDTADEEDFLLVLAYCGAPASLFEGGLGSLYCLDGAFSSDDYIDVFDLGLWDWTLSDLDRTNLCFEPLPLVAGGTTGLSALAVPASATRSMSLAATDSLSNLVILGKGQLSTVLSDGLYTFGSDTAYLGKYAAAGLRGRCNQRLVRDPAGNLYAVNSEYGVIRLTGSVRTVIPLGQADYSNEPRYHSMATVSIGLQGQGSESIGRPVLDVAFDTQGYAYVVPVVVKPRGESPYVAAAKLRVQQSASLPYQVVRLYDDPPAPNDNRDPNHQREIEVDAAGNVYVINADRFNEGDILWRYNWDGTMLDPVYLSGPNSPVPVADPLALHVCADGQTLYLASGQRNPADANAALVYAFSCADLQYTGSVTIQGMHRVTGITEDPVTGTIWVAGFAMGEIPPYPSPYAAPFYKPCLALVPSGTDRAEAVPLSNPPLHDLSLPTSIVWTGATPE